MLPKLLLAVLLCLAVGAAVIIAYARPAFNASNGQEISQTATSSVVDAGSANLAMQPEAVKLSRRVRGERFDARKPRSVILQGVLTKGTDDRNVQIKRSQSETGEDVEVAVAGANGTLQWNAASGARSSVGLIALSDRTLLERLTFDGADEFILAQLRGASYYTVARSVRPDDAPENYSGPLWDVVRIDEPTQDEASSSRWRLYYINSITGLIDKVVYDSQGDRIEANFLNWTEQNGEKFPGSITWTSQGQPLLTFKLTSVSIVAQ